MQHQICPRCKFRLVGVKTICNTCGYALQNQRRPQETAAPLAASPVKRNTSVGNNSSNANNLRQVQTNVQTKSAGSFWRAFFGLDPLPSDKADRDEPALGET